MSARNPTRTELHTLALRLAGLLDGPRARIRPWLERLTGAHGRWAEFVYARWRRGPTAAEPPERGPTPRLLLDRARRALSRGSDASTLHRLVVDAATLAADQHLERFDGVLDPTLSGAALAVAAALEERFSLAPDPLDGQRVLRARWVWAATRWRRGESVPIALATELTRGFARLVRTRIDADGCAWRLRLCARNLGADLLLADRPEEALHWRRHATSALRAAAGRGGLDAHLAEAHLEFARLALDTSQPGIAVEQLEAALRTHTAPGDIDAAERNDFHALLVDAYRRAGMLDRATMHIELLLQGFALRRQQRPSDVQAAYDETWWCGQMVQLLAEDGRTHAALPWSRSGVLLAERLAARHPKDLWPRSHCAWQTAWLAYLFLETGRDKPTRTWLHRALDRVEQLPPGTAQKADLRAWLLRMEGNRLVSVGELEEAERSLQKSLQIAAGSGGRPQLPQAAAWAYEDLARLHGRRRRAGRAIGLLRQAIAIWERAGQEPQGSPVRELARCYRYAAELHAARGEMDRAWRYRQQADEIEARES